MFVRLLNKNIISTIFIVFFMYPTLNAQFSHSIQNYSLSEYNGGNQNWDIAKSKNGKLFVANNEGLLEFDGLNWNLWEMPNKTTIRSLLFYKDKIYVGSYEEFGYWSRDNKGILNYTSLIKDIDKNKIKADEEFWQILLLNDSIIFRSFSNIYIYYQDKITSFNLPSTIMSCNIIDGKLYASTLNDGIFTLRNNKFKLFFNDNILRNTRIVSLNKIKSDQFLISTALKGCFILKNKKINTWKSEINNILKKHQLNRFYRQKNGNFIFGTIKNGIYIVDYSGKILYNINTKTGLLNNTVLGLYIDKNELWAGLDNGISFIDLNTSSFFYNDLSKSLGAVYDVINYKNNIYIGSNTGLYYINGENVLQFIDGSQGQVWDLKEINGELFCGHNNGTYLVKQHKLKLISGYTGGWVIKKVPEQKNLYIQGTYTGLVRFEKINSNWTATHYGNPIIPIRFLVFQDVHNAWIAHAHKGVFKIRFDDDYKKILEIKNYGNKGLWSTYNVRINKFKNTITFHTQKGWQKYDEVLDSIISFDFLNEKLKKNSYIISEDDVHPTTLKVNNEIVLYFNAKKHEKIYIPNNYYQKKLIYGYENVSKINDSLFALNLYNGFMLINPHKFSKKSVLIKPTIENVLINNKYIPINSKNIQLPFKGNNIKIKVSSPLSKNHNFEYHLVNAEIDSTWIKLNEGELELSNLRDGDYQVFIRAIGYNKNKSIATQIHFVVLPPFYKSKSALLIYFLLVLLIVIVSFFLHKRKIKRQQTLLKQKYKEEQKRLLDEKSLENEKEIIKLKNESLKNEIKLKSKQLANTAMALVKKNEILLILKKELLLHKNSFENQYAFKKLIKQIDNSIEHEDEWEVFEYNFNQVHDEFFNQLKSQYPNLTHKDLKICAYLKMNLTTKEIAPLMNISVRGVETHRYRLKRKLDLNKNESLITFLQKFH